MHVKVRKMNFAGRQLFKEERAKSDVYTGELKVREDRLHKLGRVVLVATLTCRVGDSDSIMQLLDVVLLWMDNRTIRLRGFELADDTEYAQVWEVEVL